MKPVEKAERTCLTCGKTFFVYKSAIGKYCSRSCQGKHRAFKHGCGGNTKASRSSEYVTWNCMMQRCTNEKRSSYALYGGSGITVCDEWKRFENFLSDMGKRPTGTTIDRINPLLGYFKDNCRWATSVEQNSHLLTSLTIEYAGRTVCLGELSRITGVPSTTLSNRLRKGLPIEDVVRKGKRSSTYEIQLDGETVSLSDLSKRTGIPFNTLAYRVKQNWSIEKIIAQSPRSSCSSESSR